MDALILFLLSFFYVGLPIYCAVMIYRIGEQLERDMNNIYENFEKRMELEQNRFERSLQVESDILDGMEGR